MEAPGAIPDGMEDEGIGPRANVPLKFLIGGLVIVATLVSLVGWAMSREGSTSFYYSTTEVAELGSRQDSAPYRVHGKVLPGSIRRSGLTSSFVITDGQTELRVTTEAPLPDTLKDESEVVARGYFDGANFAATEVLAKCPSKFKAKA